MIMNNLEDYIKDVQRQIGYHFDDTKLLFQAFTRRSYSQENGGENNEVLEFIGDDELLEVTPKNIRIRKRILDSELRAKAAAKIRKGLA